MIDQAGSKVIFHINRLEKVKSRRIIAHIAGNMF